MKASLIDGDYLRFVAAKQAHGAAAVRSWRGSWPNERIASAIEAW
jgi:hypothetical protein